LFLILTQTETIRITSTVPTPHNVPFHEQVNSHEAILHHEISNHMNMASPRFVLLQLLLIVCFLSLAFGATLPEDEGTKFKKQKVYLIYKRILIIFFGTSKL